eukprot:RCo041317
MTTRPMLSFVPVGSVADLFHWNARRELGRGTFAVVYHATCATSHAEKDFKGITAGTAYAVKAILKDEGTASYVHHEVGILKSLDSEYFARLYYAFQDQSTVYLVQELVESRELFEVMLERRTLTERIAADVARQLFEALVYLHNLDIIHRDLKLENVLVKEDPQNAGKFRIKVVDLGLAKFIGSRRGANCPYTPSTFDELNYIHLRSPAASSIASSGLVTDTPVGTFRFCDVHALHPLGRNKTRLSTRRDIRKIDSYAVGVIIYLMLSGCFPFPSEEPLELAAQIQAGVRFPSPHFDKISAQAKDLVTQLLHPERARRPFPEDCLGSPWLNCAAPSEEYTICLERKPPSLLYEHIREVDGEEERQASCGAASRSPPHGRLPVPVVSPRPSGRFPRRSPARVYPSPSPSARVAWGSDRLPPVCSSGRGGYRSNHSSPAHARSRSRSLSAGGLSDTDHGATQNHSMEAPFPDWQE